MSGPYQQTGDNGMNGPNTDGLMIAGIFVIAAAILFGLHFAFRGNVQF